VNVPLMLQIALVSTRNGSPCR